MQYLHDDPRIDQIHKIFDLYADSQAISLHQLVATYPMDRPLFEQILQFAKRERDRIQILRNYFVTVRRSDVDAGAVNFLYVDQQLPPRNRLNWFRGWNEADMSGDRLDELLDDSSGELINNDDDGLHEPGTSGSRSSNSNRGNGVGVCTVCMTQPATAVIWPCRHLYQCRSCAERSCLTAHRENKQFVCALCRLPVNRVERIYPSYLID